MQPHFLTKLKDYPEILTNKKELQTLLGIVNYVAASYCRNIANIKRPLQLKLRGNIPFNWTPSDT